ncbi:MAG: cytidylate kinase family protein [Patescibacteria group bacterium]|nr:cytidylate kinase family protein [Patescibacteria group bacterium]
MIISISGKPGSGKSSVAEAIAREFGLKRYYIGGLRREMARQRGLTLEDLNRLGEREDFTDREVDEYQKKLGETEDNFVIEGRTSFFLIPRSYKIFLDIEVEEGAKRIWKDLQIHPEKRNEMANPKSLADVIASVKNRMASDERRYQKYYNKSDIFNPKNYDYILDTTKIGKEEEIKIVIEHIRKNVVPREKRSD